MLKLGDDRRVNLDISFADVFFLHVTDPTTGDCGRRTLMWVGI